VNELNCELIGERFARTPERFVRVDATCASMRVSDEATCANTFRIDATARHRENYELTVVR
jgi:hypothetical protein